MAAWDSNPSVTIGGLTWDSRALNSISITMGRTSVDDQARAGYCRIQLLNHDNVPAGTLNINDLGWVTIEDSNGQPERVFTGYVTDIKRTLRDVGPSGQVAIAEFTLVGPLSRLSRRESEASYAKQYDGDRIADILEGVFSTSWAEVVPPTLTWANVDPAVTWSTYDPGYAGSIEQPGAYELTAYAGGVVEALSLAQAAAQSALGILHEERDGTVSYDSATTRITRVANLGYTELNADYLTGVGMSSMTNSSQIINRMRLTYKNNAVASGEETDSQALYGLFAAQRNTQLELQAQAEQQIGLYMTTRAYPRISLEAITVPLHNPNLADALRDTFIKIYSGLPLSIPNIPLQIDNEPFTGFVEGWTWQIDRKTATLTMTVSDYALTAISVQWNQVPASELWNTLNSTLTWENARTVA